MKNISPLQQVLAWFAGIVVSFILILNTLQISAPRLSLEDPGYRFFSLINSSLFQMPLSSLMNVGERVASFWRTQEENEAYRKELELISLYQAKLEESYREIEALKKLAELKTTYSQYELVSAKISSRSVDSFNHTISINVGERDGVELNDAVISSKGLIGKVVDVTENESIVLLLTTETSLNKVSVKIQIDPSKTAEAILERYDPNVHAYILKLLDTQSTITEGMKVISSGIGGAFPSGLIVGEVSKVESLSNAIGLRIEVDPAADFYNIDYIAVVKTYE